MSAKCKNLVTSRDEAPANSRLAGLLRHADDLAEVELDLLALVRADRHLLRFGAQLFVPGLDRVRACGKVFDLETSVLSADCEVWAFNDRNVTLHPWMHIALHGNRNFLTRECFLDRQSGRL